MGTPNREAAEIACDCLASRARHLDRVLARTYDGELRPQGVTGSQLGMLVAIELSGPTTPARLGRLLELDRSTVSRNLARLADTRLVKLSGGLRITPRGSALIKTCHPLWKRAQQKATALLGAPSSRLLAALPSIGSKT